jgi:hypothetical protein
MYEENKPGFKSWQSGAEEMRHLQEKSRALGLIILGHVLRGFDLSLVLFSSSASSSSSSIL